MNPINLATKFLLREWRSGELYILIAVIIIAIAALSSISFYTDRVARALDNQATELLGGDLMINSPSAIPQTWIKQAQASHLNYSQIIYFPTVAVAGQQLQLVDVKAVTPSYPLVGNLRISNNINQSDQLTNSIPAAGTIWVAPSVLSLLPASVGSTITIGVQPFVISHI